MRKGQGRRPLLDACGLRALRQHCITHRHDSVIDITKWAQAYFQKPLSVNTIRRAICRCQLKLYHAKRKPNVNMVQKSRRVLWAKAHLKCPVSKWKSVLWSDESKFDILVGNHGRCVLRAKEEGDLPACHQHSVQQDNAKPHTAAITTTWLRSRRVRVLNWPACIIKRKIHQRRPQTLQQLETYQARMGPNSKTKLQKLITSMPRRLQTVLKRRGDASPW